MKGFAYVFGRKREAVFVAIKLEPIPFLASISLFQESLFTEEDTVINSRGQSFGNVPKDKRAQ